jgi:hypothetical protein
LQLGALYGEHGYSVHHAQAHGAAVLMGDIALAYAVRFCDLGPEIAANFEFPFNFFCHKQ